MLSIETPPDPSCSSKASRLTTDERASGQLAFQEADPVGFVEAQAPKFSIRDYALTSRGKSIGTNWPFPQHFLKLCLKHGVSDLLPPFEPPDLVRAQCCRKTVESKQQEADQKISSQVDLVYLRDFCTKTTKPKSCLPSDELVVDQDRYPLPEKRKLAVDQGDILGDRLTDGDAEIVSTVTSHDPIERISDQISELHINTSLSEASSQLEVSVLPPPPAKLDNSRESSEKKCRLVLKLSAISEARRPEDIASTSSTVSDPMASKVCPVCKIFSSTSNTTLNAHIDQCLSIESNTNRVVTNTAKLRVKTRKKRLMEDIYATAPYGTLEDLDRRNGTNWAANLSFVAPAGEACTETKRPKLSPVATRADVNEGAVYVDSNGIKIRILSKFNDTPPVMPREEFKLKKHVKEIKEEKSCLLVSKKEQFSSKYLKDMKVKPPSKKLQSSFELYKGEMQAAPEGDHQADTPQEKEESQFQTVNPRDQIRSSGSATLRKWVCSKRSDLPKKINKKDIHKSSENRRLITRIPLPESNQPDLGSSPIVRSHVLKFSRSSEALTSSPKAKRVDSLQTTGSREKKSPNPPVFNSRWSSESTLTNGHMRILSRSSGTSSSSPSRKSEETPMDSTQKTDNSSDIAARPSDIGHPSLKAKKIATLKKNVFVERPSFTLEANNGDVSEKVSKKFHKHRSILVTNKRGGELPSDVNGASKTTKTHRPYFSKSVTRPETEEVVNQMSPRRSNIPGSEQEKEEIATVGQVPLGAECHDIEVVTKPTMEKVDGDHVSSEALISDKPTPHSIAIVEPKPSQEQNVQSMVGGASNDEPTAQHLFDKQVMQCCDVTIDGIVSQNNQMADEVEFRGEYVESRAETVSAQESSACLTSHGDVGLEIPHENSSITSIRIISDPDHTLASDREASLSPVSTATTISPPSPRDSQPKDTEAELFVRPKSIEGSQVRDVEMVSVAKEPEQFPDDQPCCCSRREDLSREFQFLRHNIMAGTMLPSKEKQISNLYIAPSTFSSSSSSYPSPRTNAMESPTESISTRSSSDSAVKFPSYSAFGSPSPSSTPSTPNSILRLMGKNLMVVNKDESSQLPKVHHSASDNPLPSLGFASTGNFVNQESFWYPHHHQLPSGSSVLSQAPSIVAHHMPLHPGLMKKLNKKPNSSPSSAHQHYQKQTISSSRAPYMKEVIVIDDSPETNPEPRASLASPSSTLPTFPGSDPMVQQWPFSCFPSSQSQFIYAEPSKRGSSNSEGSGHPLVPGPLLFRSPAMYYSQTF